MSGRAAPHLFPWVLSAGAHVVALVAFPGQRREPTPPPAAVDADEVTFAVTIEESPSEVALARPLSDRPQSPERAARTRSLAPSVDRPPSSDPPPSDPPTPASLATPAALEPLVAPEHPPPRDEGDAPAAVAPPEIAPEHVARSWLGSDAITPEGEARRAERAIEERLDAELRARAMAKAYVSRRRIELVPRRDGSYLYRGEGFSAVIRGDGSVEFGDRDDFALGARDALQTDGSGAAVEPRGEPELPDALAELVEPLAPFVDPFAAVSIDPNVVRAPDGTSALPELLTAPGGAIETSEPPGIGLGIGGTFDAQGAAMRAAGQDPHSAERLRFLEETEDLRDRLTDAQAARERAAALRRLRVSLRRIWAGTQPATDRRRAIFELWDGCSEDEVGRRAREAIVRFVRSRLPRGSADAFAREELDALNASRESAEPFAPYE